MRRSTLLAAAVLAIAAAPAAADDAAVEQSRVVVVNATAGNAGPVARIHRVLDARNLLFNLDADLEATLDGRNGLIDDLDAIQEDYARSDFDAALAIIDKNEQRLLAEPVGHDLAVALAELAQWRGLVAAAQNNQDDAELWFRAAFRFNPALVIPDKLQSPRVRSLIKRAKHEPDAQGSLKVRSDDDAQMAVDGGDPTRPGETAMLPIGMHLVVVTAPKRRPHAELVEIRADKLSRLEAQLDDESKLDRAARMVDATAAAPSGQPRLKRANALSKLTGAQKLLVIEDSSGDNVTLRIYDTAAKRTSRMLQLDSSASSAFIAREITAALEPNSLLDAKDNGAAASGKPWYHH
ncbi:MAG TPA: hypothetical protein VL326_12500 [Kofleriaceae bacterium]|nr:hypothetical protein [Kofleriaceae bacterium]